VDLVTGRLVVRRSVYRADKIGTPKSGKDREIPLNAEALQAMKQHRHVRGPLVFCQNDGAMLAETETCRPLAMACKVAGLRTVSWHTLRHTFASHLVMRGQPLKAVQELMGHASIEMTMRYAHLSPEVRRDAVNALSAPRVRQHDGNAAAAGSEKAGSAGS
jgi:site-specific recombinase XerD